MAVALVLVVAHLGDDQASGPPDPYLPHCPVPTEAPAALLGPLLTEDKLGVQDRHHAGFVRCADGSGPSPGEGGGL